MFKRLFIDQIDYFISKANEMRNENVCIMRLNRLKTKANETVSRKRFK